MTRRNRYINTFDTTSQFDTYIESAEPGFPNVALTEDDGAIHYTQRSPNDYQIWGTTTATSNFNIKLNGQNVEVTVDPDLGEFYLMGWTGTLTSLDGCFYQNNNITSIKKFAIDASSVTNIQYMFYQCTSLTSVNLSTFTPRNNVNVTSLFNGCSNIEKINLQRLDLTSATGTFAWNNMGSNPLELYLGVEASLMRLTNNLSSAGSWDSSSYWQYLPTKTIIYYDDGVQDIEYRWQNNAWTAQS